MKRKIKYLIIVIFIVAIGIFAYDTVSANEYVNQTKELDAVAIIWNDFIAGSINNKIIEVNVDGNDFVGYKSRIIMDSKLILKMPVTMIRDMFDCAVNIYENGKIIIDRGNTNIILQLNSNEIEVNHKNYDLSIKVEELNDLVYVPLDCIVENFGYSYQFDVKTNKATLTNNNPDERTLPYQYNYRDIKKIGKIRNQGYFGTCWAQAAISALETSLLPQENLELSVDNMSINNSFGLNQYSGGDYSMAIAYLAAWQGPVLEKDDPYGDNVSGDEFEVQKHVQEAMIIPAKDYESIKKMVYKYGGVTTSMYTSMSSSYEKSKYYNSKTNSYCYIGEEKPNHNVLIVGWDDNYDKNNFKAEIERNGAFICQNSWGEEFGDNGLFYVSYYDTNIGIHNVVYTSIEDTDNYDNIYQTDLCGWRGNLGYERENAYFANIYTAKGHESLAAVSFYAVDVDTKYEIFICKEFKDVKSLKENREILANGTLKNAGYYTINLSKQIELKKGEKFAVIVKVTTPNNTRPIAVEINQPAKNIYVDLLDGEGYISFTGNKWENVEEKYNCNICLKCFTKIKE